MSRAARLLDLLQALRRRRRPVSGQALAAELGVSLRTLYRDIATLQAQGAAIEGAAGLGYVLRPGFDLPPLMFTPEEIDVLALGTRWVLRRGDPAMVAAARDALAKLAAVLPDGAAVALFPLLAGPGGPAGPSLAVIRRAMRTERKLRIAYRDGSGKDSERLVWPLAVGFFDSAELLVAWCETRADFRHFRLDRIQSASVQDDPLPRRRDALLRAWRLGQGMEDELG